jgi:aspartyl-tRNA(Asn)/glutamyl-tRNA(Gln) amidotransferase subunit A
MARTVRDAALLFGAMCGPDTRDPISLPDIGEDFPAACDELPGRLRVGWTTDLGYAPVDPRVAAVVADAVRAFADFGCELGRDSPGFPDPEQLFLRATAPIRAAAYAQYLDRWGDQMDPLLTGRMHMADDISSVEYERLFQERTTLWHAVRRFFERYDLLLTPTLALPPFPLDQPYPPTEVAGHQVTSPIGWFPFTFPFNLTGHPAVVLPLGRSAEGLPIGLQVVGRRWGEMQLLAIAARLAEMLGPWQCPPGY